jgi:methionyl-tRNA synthetase
VAADLYAVLEASRWIAVLITPLLPDLAGRMQSQLEQPQLSGATTLTGGWQPLLRWGLLESGQALPEPQPVMQRLELDTPL